MGSFGIVAPSPGVCKNCTCPTGRNRWLGETTENNNHSCLTSIECSVSQVHAEFLALSHFIHYLISPSQKPYEVDIIHPILPEVRKIKRPTPEHTSSKCLAKARLHFLMGPLTELFRLYWRGSGSGSSGRSSMEEWSPFLLPSPTLGEIHLSLAFSWYSRDCPMSVLLP